MHRELLYVCDNPNCPSTKTIVIDSVRSHDTTFPDSLICGWRGCAFDMHPQVKTPRITGDGFMDDLIAGIQQGKLKIIDHEREYHAYGGGIVVKLHLEVVDE